MKNLSKFRRLSELRDCVAVSIADHFHLKEKRDDEVHSLYLKFDPLKCTFCSFEEMDTELFLKHILECWLPKEDLDIYEQLGVVPSAAQSILEDAQEAREAVIRRVCSDRSDVCLEVSLDSPVAPFLLGGATVAYDGKLNGRSEIIAVEDPSKKIRHVSVSLRNCDHMLKTISSYKQNKKHLQRRRRAKQYARFQMVVPNVLMSRDPEVQALLDAFNQRSASRTALSAERNHTTANQTKRNSQSMVSVNRPRSVSKKNPDARSTRSGKPVPSQLRVLQSNLTDRMISPLGKKRSQSVVISFEYR